ncbi:hypothetical protein SUGI_0037530 [Cryptomeria japonica]|nr:hypothetical protein SUGI_0037530 [Cryptomeria japonica]
MIVAIYIIFIHETEEVAPVSLPLRSVVMTVINYRRGEKEEIAECVICLSEFQEEEEVARIDCCGSRFHVECIGMWAQSKGRTCPICHASYLRG